VLVTHDLLGLTGGKPLKFVKRYADIGKELHEAFTRYRQEVEAGAFPALEHSFNISEEELEALKG
jgi:3-methyl-2-oxobutanoate hydroxymethyltransferase